MSPIKVRKSILYGIATVLTYFLFSTITMLFYSGGDQFNPTLPHYNFFGSFLSDLGRTQGFSGNSTHATALFYALGLIIMGSGTIVFFIAHNYLILKSNKILRYASNAAGLLAGIGYIGIAVTPWNLWPKIHLFFVFTGFLSFMAASMLLFILIRRQPNYPNTYGNLYLLIGVLIGSYVLLLLYGPDSHEPWGRIVQSTGQKIVVYSQSLLILVCGIGALKLCRKNIESLSDPTGNE